MPTFRLLLVAAGLAAVGLAAWYFTADDAEGQRDSIVTAVREGPFEIYAAATGELQAKNSVKIRGPQGMRAANIYQTTISDMVPEGTVVEAGGYVAELDRTEVQTKMAEANAEIDLINTQLEQARIDTAIELRGLRDELVNARFAREERLLEVEQSKYEPQMVIRAAEIELERSDRDYAQLEKKYDLTLVKAAAQVGEIQARLKQQTDKLDRLARLGEDFTVTAPTPGMVIYARNWNGKVGPGSQISTWDPVVAELPDLTEMVSKTYVNEVDIARVRPGQSVRIAVDAFPDKSYTGTVTTVANIGEQLKGYDAKVFEVLVGVHEADSILRPAMTTSNEILTHTFASVLSIPLEALHRDSAAFVYRPGEGGGRPYKQEVVVGELNDDAAVVAHGLAAGDEVLLTVPAGADDLRRETIEATVRATVTERLARERAEREARARRLQREAEAEAQPQRDDAGGGGVVIFG